MRPNIRVFIVALVAIVAIGLVLFATLYDNTGSPNAAPPAADVAAAQITAPEITAPPDGSYFVESDLTLAWEWPSALAENQVFAVRVWYGDEDPREVWTADTSLSAQDMIDSYIQELGEFHWEVAVIQMAEGGGFERMVSEWTPVQTLNRVRHISPDPYPEAQQSPLTRYIVSQNLPTVTAVIDFTRNLIYDNAQTGMAENNLDSATAMQTLYDALQGSGDKPHMWCDGRSTVFLNLLREMGIDSRLIFLYGDNSDSILEHTVLEVFNLDTQFWEVQDTLNNLYYVDTTTQARASVERMVFGSLKTIIACDGATNTCGPEGLKDQKRYYEGFRYGYSDTFWINPDRFDISKRFQQNNHANLPEYLTGNPRDFKFIFDNWVKNDGPSS
jgi:hypothetical protein